MVRRAVLRTCCVAAVLSVTTASLLACSLFTDLSGFSENLPTTEGGPGPSGVDGGSDSGTSDAEAGADAGPPFCSTQPHAFCADFENGDLLTGWTKKQTDPIGALALSDIRSRSPRRSLFAMLPRRDQAEPPSRVTLDKFFEGPFKRVVVELDVYLEGTEWHVGDINSALVGIEFFSSLPGDAVFLSIGKEYANLNDTYGVALPNDQWVHVKIDVDQPAGKVVAKVGMQPYSIVFTPKAAGAKPAISISVGINGFNAPVPRFAAYYDNVTVDFP